MSLRNILPHIIQPFRLRHTEQPTEPISIGPVDMLQLMEFVERASVRRSGEFAPGRMADDSAVLVPEPGFRY